MLLSDTGSPVLGQLWGRLACGRSGQIQIEVDQSCGPEELLALDIAAPNWSLRFGIPRLSVVRKLVTFLSSGCEESLAVGTFDSATVEVLRDREHDDRFFIVVSRGRARAEFIIAGKQQISDLSRALSEAAEDLE